MSKAQYRLPLWALKAAIKLSGRPTGVSGELKQIIADRGCIFIHIPKCAGTAVQKSLFGDTYFGHQTIRQYQVALPISVYRRAWKFTITRDPWERLVSAWRFLKAGGYHINVDEVYFRENLSQFPTFDHFVNDWLVYQDVNHCGCVHFKTQLHYIQDFNGKIAMDHIVKLSDLPYEYPKLRNRFSGGELIVDNQTKADSVEPQSYFACNETFNNVASIYAKDIKVLGYSSRLGEACNEGKKLEQI